MSVNVGATVSNAVTLTPSPETMTLTPISSGVTGVTNAAVDITASIDSMTLSSLSATIGANVIVQPGVGSMSLTAQVPSVDYTPIQGDVTVDTNSPTMTLSAINAGVSSLSGETITTVTMEGSGTGAVTFGHLFAEGDTVGDSASISGGQVTSKTTWPDGSIRFAIISGIFTGGSTYDIASGTSSGGNLTEAQLITALGTTTIALSGGASGTINAANLISGAATPTAPGKVAWQDGQYCIERIVGAQISGNIYGFFHCRYYSDGALSVDFVIENAEALGTAPDTVNGVTVTFTLAGSTVHTEASQSIYHNSRFMETYWNSDPGLHAKPDLDYFYSTKATPKYLSGAATPTHVSSVDWDSVGNLRTTWGDTGYHDQIGPLPEWDVAAIRNGFANIDSVVANAKAFNHSNACFKDNTTGYPFDLLTNGQYDLDGWGTNVPQGSGAELCTDSTSKASHSPVIGMLAYALTGKYYFLETQWYCAVNCLLQTGVSGRYLAMRDNAALIWDKDSQRQSAWTIANTVRCAYIAPDDITYAGQFETFLANGFTQMYGLYPNGAGNNVFGINEAREWYPTFFRPFMHDFCTGAVLEAARCGFGGTYKTEIADFVAQWVQGRVSYLGNTNFCWQYGPSYDHNNVAPYDGSWMSDWATFFAAAYPAVSSCDLNGTFQDTSLTATSYAANMLYPLAEARGLGYIGQTEVDRYMAGGLTVSDFDTSPVWGFAAREPVAQTALEIAAASLSAGEWTEVTTNNMLPAFTANGSIPNPLPFTSEMPWDPVNKKIQVMGNTHGNPVLHCTYDEASNTWTYNGQVSTGGHAYDHVLVDPNTGDMYYSRYNNPDLAKKPYGGSWNHTFTSFPSSNISITRGACYVPASFTTQFIAGSTGGGLFFHDTRFGNIYIYDIAQDSWYSNSSPPTTDSYHAIAAYSHVYDCVVSGGGNRSTGNINRLFRFTSDETWSEYPTYPVTIGIQRGTLTTDPVSGKFLIRSGTEFWELEPTGNGTYTQLSAPPSGVNNMDATNDVLCTVPISSHGVVGFISASGTSYARLHIYKHA